MDIEVFPAGDPPHTQTYSEALAAGVIWGNMGSLIVIKLGAGLELEEHSHDQEHVGAVLQGEFSFFDGPKEAVLRAGDLYKIKSGQRHGVRCINHAIIVQAREPGPPVA